MSRIDTSHWHSIIELSSMVIDLRTCLKANVPIDPTTRQDAIYTIEASRRDIERCRTVIEDMIKGDGHDDGRRSIADFYIMDHMECVGLLNDLSIALKLNNPYDLILLDRLEAEVNKLEDCRESMISYRHVRGQGYVR